MEEKIKDVSKIDLLEDDYAFLSWPAGEIHSKKFPYLLARIKYGVYSVASVPAELKDLGAMIFWAKDIAISKGIQVGLVVGTDECYYANPNGNIQRSNQPPSGGSVVNWRKLESGEIEKGERSGTSFFREKGKNEFHVNIPMPSLASSMGKDQFESIADKSAEEITVQNKNLNREVPVVIAPHHLNIKGRPELSIFPLNFIFAVDRVKDGKRTGTHSAMYMPRLESYKKEGEKYSMEYLNVYGGKSWLVIEYDVSRNTYIGRKIVNEKSAGTAIGARWDGFFFHLSTLGLAAEERYKFENLDDKFMDTLNNENLGHYIRKGGILINSGAFKEAIDIYNEVIKFSPNNIESIANKGIALDAMGKHHEAIDLLNEALIINPNDATVLIIKGFTLNKLGEYREALMISDEILNIAPGNANALEIKRIAMKNLENI